MEKILNHLLESKSSWKQALRKASRNNGIGNVAHHCTPRRIEAQCQLYAQKHVDKKPEKLWLQNQLKTYHWLCIALSATNSRKLTDFEESDWNVLTNIFHFKDPIVLKYEALILTFQSRAVRPWQPEEKLQLLELMINQPQNFNRWSHKARQLFEHSQGRYLRSGKQCREKYLNHLNPANSKEDWSQQEDRQIVTSILRWGRKWSKIAKNMDSNRTEHMIKKHYKKIISDLKNKNPSIKDEDTLLSIFVNGEPTGNQETLTKIISNENSNEYIQRADQKVKEDLENDLLQQSTEKRRFEASTERMEYEGMEQIIEQIKEYAQIHHLQSEIQQESQLSLFSPWLTSGPKTPVLSPSRPFSFQNFTSIDQVHNSYFYLTNKPFE